MRKRGRRVAADGRAPVMRCASGARGCLRTSGGIIQKFTVPAGATRLYVGSMDGQQWSDNAGGFSVTVASGMTTYHVSTVK